MMNRATLKNYILIEKNSILKFLLVGLTTAGVYLSLFSIFWRVFDLSYSMAVSIGYILSIIFYFYAQRHFTFCSADKPLSKQIFKFSAMTGINYFLTIVIVRATVENLVLSPYIGIFFATVITTISNYAISRFWIFQKIG